MTVTFDIVLVIAMLAGFALFGLAMYGVTLRVGPRNGHWNQPAAELRPTGRRVFLALYAAAVAHVVLGLIAWLAIPGGGVSVFLVLLATAAFYVLCAHSWAIAHRLPRRDRAR